MVRFYPNEEFKEIIVPVPQKLRYAVSNRGRLVSFTDRIENGNLIKGGRSDGYATLRYRATENGKTKSKVLFLYKIVAEFFLPKPLEGQDCVIHLDYVRDNDDVKNLRWVTYAERIAHGKKSPHVIRARRELIEHNIKSDGSKLTATTVIRIKKMLKNPKGRTRNSMIAKQFGISATHLKRIETGENWGHIVV
ncbi:NUMOD4 domain-containing protein [Flavobacterium lotistagni]|uniref:NUMOD4 domain-containing protein n=1 Tax=Flavobacterium lotistagni TaxID=2709660 RepID=UPI001A9C2BC2|nr:NUMOD4 domain-containing protein [Flavobacterium lotistagni]